MPFCPFLHILSRGLRSSFSHMGSACSPHGEGVKVMALAVRESNHGQVNNFGHMRSCLFSSCPAEPIVLTSAAAAAAFAAAASCCRSAAFLAACCLFHCAIRGLCAPVTSSSEESSIVMTKGGGWPGLRPAPGSRLEGAADASSSVSDNIMISSGSFLAASWAQGPACGCGAGSAGSSFLLLSGACPTCSGSCCCCCWPLPEDEFRATSRRYRLTLEHIVWIGLRIGSNVSL